MRVEITRREFFDESERRKRKHFCIIKHLTSYQVAKEFKVSKQYLYSIIAGKVAITKSIRKMFEEIGYEITKGEE